MIIESDLPPVLCAGFLAVLLLAALVLFFCFRRRSKRVVPFFVLQGVFTAAAFRFALSALSHRPGSGMFTESVSLDVGLGGLCWGVSICFMLAGIWRLSRSK